MYGLIHFPGDVTPSDDLLPGRILGADAFDRPFVVGDVEFAPGRNQTDVHLRPAEPHEVRAEIERLMGLARTRGQLPAIFQPPEPSAP